MSGGLPLRCLTGHQVEVALESKILFSLVPQVPKEFCCGRTVPGIVIVAESKTLQDFAVTHHLLEKINPIPQIVSAVDDGLVPRRCLLLNLFAVSKPANLGEVRC